MRCLSAVVLTSILVLPLLAGAATESPARQKAVLVTGASTGIGRKVAERLAGDGYFVYAGARKDADIAALGRIENIQGVRLDVTRQEDIDAALAAIKQAGRGLYALINNAGAATSGSVIDSTLPEFDLTMQVNVYGPWRVTKAFAPLIVAEQGRIVTTGSISGILAGANTSAYVMSKHAIEGFTDSLAAEMAPLGVRVSVVEPGTYKTEIYRTAAKRLGGANLQRADDLDQLPEPDDVAAAFAAALSDPQPKRRYLVTPVEDQARRTLQKQIAQLVQLNEGQAFTYDRATLIQMLDEALAGSRSRTADTPTIQSCKRSGCTLPQRRAPDPARSPGS
ncbi:MAG TPA: SDR family NAD(P)-dependent oxidoreductase [Steroidobacteraceae bacterium]|jgi:NAD(P)-dependent dehydrogenase (short-subunit alcohol dehydrogenase family)